MEAIESLKAENDRLKAGLDGLKAQEPAWYKELGTMEIEHPSRYRKRVDIGSINGFDYVPLYAHPLPAQSVPEGWQLVPIEPTKEMCDAYCEGSIAPIGNLSCYGYKAMLSAAPKP